MASVLINDVFVIHGKIVFVGTVQQDSLKPGMVAQVQGYSVKVEKIEAHHAVLPEAFGGQKIGFSVQKISGPAEAPRGLFDFFSKDNYSSTMKSMKNRTLEFE